VVLKGYFDGGNQADSTQYDRIALATACGTIEEWTAFESAWKENLAVHHAPFLHVTDAIGLQKTFSKQKGWNYSKVDTFICDCVSIIEQHMVVPGRIFVPAEDRLGLRLNIAKPGLNIFTFTIPLKDYKRARLVVRKLPNSATELCATESVSIVFKWGRRIGVEWYELYFDQGEPFYGHIYGRRHNKKSKRQITPMKKVVHLGESDMRVVPALQVADLFAWCINHVDDVRRKWHGDLNRLPWESLVLDYNHLLTPNPDALERISTWKLPMRKLDR
jgi:hypothetical protein